MQQPAGAYSRELPSKAIATIPGNLVATIIPGAPHRSTPIPSSSLLHVSNTCVPFRSCQAHSLPQCQREWHYYPTPSDQPPTASHNPKRQFRVCRRQFASRAHQAYPVRPEKQAGFRGLCNRSLLDGIACHPGFKRRVRRTTVWLTRRPTVL